MTENTNASAAIVIHDDHDDDAIATTGQDRMEDEEPTNNEIRTAATSGENFTIPASAVEPAPSSLKCRLCPHGVQAVITAMFSTMAWFACLSKNGCDYARVTGPIVADITNNPDTPFIEAGFNYYREPVYDRRSGNWMVDPLVPCKEYNTDIVDIDAAWNFAKFASFVSLVLGGGAALFVWFSTCYVFKKNVWRWVGYELAGAVILLSLTFTWFATSMCKGNDGQDKCALNYGSRMDIIACALWTVAAMYIFCCYPKLPEKVPDRNEQHRDAGEVEMSEVEMPNPSGEGTGGTATDEHEII
eukprot:CAMPEP_0183726102 /NCGR_PEP_ID=MMETSP0737-20130205/22367_1 /TAXON_ID=385413 /ORGANISM="Thalassiosira miniscula, Strain CCMP1093" /LENGTH=300 /DNA_ID=CAMNT_0025957327 /DNA_START=156 /DNA_END=1058 /DNA_ORIENTATION=+